MNIGPSLKFKTALFVVASLLLLGDWKQKNPSGALKGPKFIYCSHVPKSFHTVPAAEKA